MIPVNNINGARGMGLEIKPGNREGFVVIGLTSAGHRLYEPVTLNAHEAGELARALAAALHAAGRVS
jgi:hypothetical protein